MGKALCPSREARGGEVPLNGEEIDQLKRQLQRISTEVEEPERRQIESVVRLAERYEHRLVRNGQAGKVKNV
jgi:hypothetical protein